MAWHFEPIEKDIVHLALKNREFAVNVLFELDPDYFTNQTCAILVNLIHHYYKHHKGIPRLEYVKSAVKKSKSIDDDEFDLLEAESIYDKMELTPSEIEFIKDNVPKFIKHSKFKQLLIDAAGQINTTELDKQDELLSNFEERFKDIMRFNIDRDLGMNIYDVEKRFMILKDRKEAEIRPCIRMLGRYIGGWARKELYAYIGAPGSGKSIILANDAWAAVQQGYNVVFISLELSEELFGLRMDMQITEREARQLLMEHEQSVKLLRKAYDNKRLAGAGDMFIKEFGTGEASIHTIERYLEMLQIYHDFAPDLVVIDYGDILRPSAHVTGDRYKDQGRSFQEMRAFATTYEIPVLTAMQSNRPERGARVRLLTEDRIADSYDKLRTLDGCYSINPVMLESDDDDHTGIVTNEHKFWIIKNRNGRSEVEIPFIMRKEIMKVQDTEESLEELSKHEY